MIHCNSCDDYVNACFHILTAKGYKKTRTRVIIAEAISQFAKPFGPKELHDQVSQSANIDFATVYRNFQIFSGCELLHAVGTQGKFVACSELHCETNTSHTIFYCRSCDMTEEVVDTSRPRKKVAAPDSFIAESLVTQVIGICADCSA